MGTKSLLDIRSIGRLKVQRSVYCSIIMYCSFAFEPYDVWMTALTESYDVWVTALIESYDVWMIALITSYDVCVTSLIEYYDVFDDSIDNIL